MSDPTTTVPDIEALHRTYCAASGMEIRADYMRIRGWHDFLKAGFTRADLVLVIAYLKKEIPKGSRNPGALKFSNLVLQLDHFEEDLALAKKSNAIAARIHARENASAAPHIQHLPNGTTRQLDDPRPPSEDSIPVGETAAAAFADLRKQAGL